ncbi:MAG: hypothetical protein JNL62_18155 [Bryobacterales bacterium]|nr:hypothetical protein [Bryobacterales bacterium]
MRFVLCSLAVLAEAVLSPHAGAAVHREAGQFLLQKYEAKNYGASPQNWAIVEDRRGLLYVGNTEGLLEFDGVNWRRIEVPNASAVRSLATDAEGRVFIGGQGIAGYLEPDAQGTQRFVSIVQRLPENERTFGNVSSVTINGDSVFFSAPERLIRWSAQSGVKTWKSIGDFRRSFAVDGVLYVTVKGLGLHRLAGDNLSLVPGGERFRDQDVRAAFRDERGVLLVTSKGLARQTLDGFADFPTDADALLDRNAVYSALRLPGGSLALGTTRGGLLLLDANGRIERILTKETGLPSDYIAAMATDRHNGVWIATGNGIARFDPSVSDFDERSGLRGSVFAVTRWNGTLYAGTSSGLFRLKAGVLGEAATFEAVEGVADAVFVLAPRNDALWVGTQRRLFRVAAAGKPVEVLATDVVYNASFSPRDPDVVYAAGRGGAFAVRAKGGKWEKSAELTASGEEFRAAVENEDGKVWVTARSTILLVDFRAAPPAVERFGAKEGLPQGWIDVFRTGGKLVFATEKGLLRFDAAQRRFLPDASCGSQFSDGSRGVLLMREDAARNLWISGFGYHGALSRSPASGAWQWRPMRLLAGGLDEFYGVHPDPDGVMWAAAPDGRLARIENPLRELPPLQVQVRRVVVGDERDALYGGAGVSTMRPIDYERNSLRVEFAAPFAAAPQRVEYQVLLEGASGSWSAWTREAWKDLSNLWEGNYRLRVRARNAFGQMSDEAAFAIRILPPWYRRWWAYALYAVAGSLFLWGVLRWRVQQLQADNQKLETIVHERTEEIRRQRDRIQEQEAKTESLLLNILPGAVADELRSTGSVTPTHFDDVTVCFTDFVGFTISSESLEARDLVAHLHEYFTEFDRIIVKYGLEKLKTIGDAYMFVSGMPQPSSTHAVDAVMAALEILESSKALALRDGGMPWRLRVGLHSGPVVAGVVGVQKFAFDIWGDTVNLASRMESSGLPDRVNLSARTYQLVKDHIECEARGAVRTKDGRELEMYFANAVAQRIKA